MIAFVTALSALWLAPQEPPAPPRDALRFASTENGVRFRVDRVPDCGAVSVWLRVAAGSHHDPEGQEGLARVLGEMLRDAMPAPAPGRPSELAVLGAATLCGAVIAPEELDAHLARIAALLGGTVALDDDAVRKARGRALLRADDESAVLPGPVLRERAARMLRPGTPDARPPGGVPEAIRAMEPEALRAAFRRTLHPRRATLVVVGDVDPERATQAIDSALGGIDRQLLDPLVEIAADVPAGEAVTGSVRVAAPFVTLAFKAPRWGEADYLPFLVAMEVVRGRAAATFRSLRGGEVAAEFPPVSYDFLRMPTCAFVQRRGADGTPLDAVRAELDSLAAGLATGGAAMPEVSAGVGALLASLELPPYRPELVEAIRRYPAMLHQRGYVVAMYDLWGWPTDLRAAIGAITVGRIDDVLARYLAEGSTVTVALVPSK